MLDNLSTVPAESALHRALEAGFAEVPKGSCVIVTSRSEPAASLARLRVAGDMTLVSGNELRIGPDEIAQFAKIRGQTVSPEAAARLYERTQGWAAGLVLMLEHSKVSGRVADVPGGAAPQVLFDYLAGEIFDRFESRTREFLLRIACLPRMTAAVAQALSGEPQAERLLVNLALNDYFVRVAPSAEGHIYQLHPLLREFLRHRAADALPEAVGIGWLRRAAAMLRDADQAEDAVSLFIEAGDWGEVAQVALEQSDTLLAQGRNETLAGWLDTVPPQLIEADPRLLFVSAAARSHTSPRSARQLYERAYDGLAKVNDRAGMMRSCCGIIDATLFEFDDVTLLDRWIGSLADLLNDSGSAPGPLDAATVATLIRALLIREGASSRLDKWVLRAQDAALAVEQDEPDDAACSIALARAMAALAHGELAAAETGLDAIRASPTQSPGAGLALALARTLHQLVRGSHADALRAAQHGLATAEAQGVHLYDDWFRVLAVAACLQTGDRDLARGELQRLEAEGARLRRGDRACMHYLRGWLAALDGDDIAAHHQARSALALAVETGIPALECLARIALAEMLRRRRPACRRCADARGDNAVRPPQHALAAVHRAAWRDGTDARIREGSVRARRRRRVVSPWP